jgi:hypothetical protein
VYTYIYAEEMGFLIPFIEDQRRYKSGYFCY